MTQIFLNARNIRNLTRLTNASSSLCWFITNSYPSFYLYES